MRRVCFLQDMYPHIQSFHEPLRATFLNGQSHYRKNSSFFFFSKKNQFLSFSFSKKTEREREKEKKTSDLPVGTESQRAGLVSSFRAVSFIHA